MNKKSLIVKIFILVIVLSLSVSFIIKNNLFNKESFDTFIYNIELYLNKYKEAAPLLFLLAFNIRILFLIFPYSIMVAIGGKIFGPVLGIVLSMIGVYTSSTLLFLLSRYFSVDFLDKKLKGRILGIEKKIENNGFKIILLMRLSMIFPFDILSFSAGATKIKYKSFIAGTLIGVIPETVSLNLLGSNIEKPFSKEFLISLIVFILFVTIIPIAIKKSKQVM